MYRCSLYLSLAVISVLRLPRPPQPQFAPGHNPGRLWKSSSRCSNVAYPPLTPTKRARAGRWWLARLGKTVFSGNKDADSSQHSRWTRNARTGARPGQSCMDGKCLPALEDQGVESQESGQGKRPWLATMAWRRRLLLPDPVCFMYQPASQPARVQRHLIGGLTQPGRQTTARQSRQAGRRAA